MYLESGHVTLPGPLARLQAVGVIRRQIRHLKGLGLRPLPRTYEGDFREGSEIYMDAIRCILWSGTRRRHCRRVENVLVSPRHLFG